jgi:hypothetical protein
VLKKDHQHNCPSCEVVALRRKKKKTPLAQKILM